MAICDRERGFSLIDTASVFERERSAYYVYVHERVCVSLFLENETYGFSTDRQL